MKKQIIINIFVNILSLLSNIITGLILTPYLIKYLGISTYGIIPLAMFFTFYIGIITQSITSSVNRYFVTEIEKNNIKNSNEIFNTALLIISIYILIQLFVLTYPILNINYFITIPDGQESNTILLFFCLLIGFSISLLSSVFTVSLYAKNRLDIIQIISIVKTIIRFILIISFFSYGYISIYYFGFSIVLSELLSLLIFTVIYKKFTPDIIISKQFVKFSRVKEIATFSGWLLIDQIGYVIFVKSDLILVNKKLGSIASAEYSIATQFSDLLKSMAALIGSVLGPVMMILYTNNKTEEMKYIAMNFMKLISFLISIPVILICFYTENLLTLWLGPEYSHLKYLIWLVTLPLVINLSVMPLSSINIAYKKVKTPAILNFVLAFIGCIIAIHLISNTSLGFYAIALGLGISLTIKNTIFIPIYTASMMKIPLLTFIKIHLNTILFCLIYSFIMLVMKEIYNPYGLYILLYFIPLGLIGLILMFFLFSKKQKDLILKNLKFTRPNKENIGKLTK